MCPNVGGRLVSLSLPPPEPQVAARGPYEETPAIAPVPEGTPRPIWSVMIPTYNASSLLEQTLRAVLTQALAPEAMQIAVVDDCSPNGEARRIVERVAPGRVEFLPQPRNVGLAGNWNGAIRMARGRWVHLLHQDDWIFPGFYEKLGRAEAACPDAQAAFCRHLFIDGDGHWLRISDLEQREPGVLDGWQRAISQSQRIQCASIVVRREFYERYGGYRADLCSALDWEMWNRIAAHGPVWYEPAVLACWRTHPANESSRLSRTGADMRDLFRTIDIINTYIPHSLQPAGRQLRADYRAREVHSATQCFLAGDRRSGLDLIRRAEAFDPAWSRTPEARAYRRWSWKLWFLAQLGRTPRCGPG